MVDPEERSYSTILNPSSLGSNINNSSVKGITETMIQASLAIGNMADSKAIRRKSGTDKISCLGVVFDQENICYGFGMRYVWDSTSYPLDRRSGYIFPTAVCKMTK